jgi:hypothetical protein
LKVQTQQNHKRPCDPTNFLLNFMLMPASPAYLHATCFRRFVSCDLLSSYFWIDPWSTQLHAEVIADISYYFTATRRTSARAIPASMGKPEQKGQQQTKALALVPLGGVTKPGKALAAAGTAAGKQQLINKTTGGPNSLAALRASMEQKLRELSSDINQASVKLEKHSASSTAVLEKTAQGHSAQANKVWVHVCQKQSCWVTCSRTTAGTPVAVVASNSCCQCLASHYKVIAGVLWRYRCHAAEPGSQF